MGQVDDVADRAVLNQMADMVVDLATPDTPPTPEAVTGRNADAGKDEKTPEPGADQVSPVDGERQAETRPDGDSYPPPGRTVIDGTDCATASGVDGSENAEDSPRDTDNGEPLMGNNGGERVSSGDNETKGPEETASGFRVRKCEGDR